MLTAEVGTIWQNAQAKSYTLWTIAEELKHEPRVIYQESSAPISDRIIYTIEDTQIKGRLGSASITPVYNGFRWRIDWYDVPVFIDGLPTSPIAWAMPMELFFLNFKLLKLSG